METAELLVEIRGLRSEAREDHQAVLNAIGDVKTTIAEHEKKDIELFGAMDKRVTIVEGTRRALVWLACALIVAILTGAADFAFNHLGKDQSNAAELPHPSQAGVSGR